MHCSSCTHGVVSVVCCTRTMYLCKYVRTVCVCVSHSVSKSFFSRGLTGLFLA